MFKTLIEKFNLIKNRLYGFLKKHTLPGFDGESIYDVLYHFIKAWEKGAISMRASSISFTFFLAIFPGIIFLFTLLPFLFSHTPYLPDQDYAEFLMQELKVWLPKDIYKISQETIYDIISKKRSGLLSFSFLLTVYFATNGFNAMMDSFNHSIHIKDKRNPYLQRLVAFFLMITFVLLLFLTILLTVAGDMGLEYMVKKGWMIKDLGFYLLKFSNYVLIVTFVYLIISFLYYFAPVNRENWRFFSAGSSMATFLIIFVSIGFGWYINNFGQYNKLYGSIGALIVLMLWIDLNSTILLIGFELNTSIKNAIIQEDSEGDLFL